MIEAGATPGPDIDVTAPYLEGPGSQFPQMPAVKSAAEARRFVDKVTAMYNEIKER